MAKKQENPNGNFKEARNARDVKPKAKPETKREARSEHKRELPKDAGRRRNGPPEVKSKPSPGFQGKCVLNPGGTPLERLRVR